MTLYLVDKGRIDRYGNMYDSLGSYQVSLKETEISMILWSI